MQIPKVVTEDTPVRLVAVQMQFDHVYQNWIAAWSPILPMLS
jgi:hypothetical protein